MRLGGGCGHGHGHGYRVVRKKGLQKKTDGCFTGLDWAGLGWTGLAGDGGYGTGRGRLLAFEPVWSGAKGAGGSVYGMVAVVTVFCYVVMLIRHVVCMCSVPGLCKRT
jgi:hypothetical protein